MTATSAVSSRAVYLKLAAVAALTIVLAVLILKQVTGINGPDYWRWKWRVHRGLIPYLLLLAAIIPLLVAQWRFVPKPGSALPRIILLMATVLAFEITDRGLDMVPFDLTRLVSITEESGSTGYFTEAENFLASGQSTRQFLGDYARLMPTFSMHACNKPPGSILFYVPFLRLTHTEDAAAMWGALTIGLLATLGVPATYLFIRELTGDRAAAFHGATFFSLCPGLLLFIPEFDQIYPVFSCALLILWGKSLQTGNAWWAVALGLAFAAICFQAFTLLVLGVFVLGYALLTIYQIGKPALTTILRQSAIAAVTVFVSYGLLWLWSGYNPVEVFVVAIANQAKQQPATGRFWPRTIPFDLTDFALGMGWVCALIALFHLLAILRQRSWRTRPAQLAILCLIQPIAVALTGLLPGETARTYAFMFPLIMLPLGLELTHWPTGPRLAALMCLWILAAILSQNMVFV
jgi:hypothetical protein